MSSFNITLDAIVPAGGQGRRMRKDINKLYLKIKGIPILYRTLFRLNICPFVGRIIVVLRKDDSLFFNKMMQKHGDLQKVIALEKGGEERSDSVRSGLEYIIAQPKSKLVLIHDGARPFFSNSLIADLTEKAIKNGGVAIPALQIAETVRQKEKNTSRVINRDSLFTTQTPQIFDVKHIHTCFLSEKQRNLQLTDEASYFEKIGLPTSIVKGEKWNIKITTPEDLPWADYLLDFYPQLKIANYDK